MANQAQLHPDTDRWFRAWSAYLDQLERAVINSYAPSISVTSAGQFPPQIASDMHAEIAQNTGFIAASTNLYNASNYTGEDIDGFPGASNLISDYMAMIKDSTSMRPLIALQRQLSMLEDFRKMFLAKRQRKVHMLQYLQQQRWNAQQLRKEIEASLMFTPPANGDPG